MNIALGASLLGALYLVSRHNYLVFHSLAELFRIVVAGAVFLLAWSSRRFTGDDALLFLGIAFLFTGFLDLMHTLAYEGMGALSSHSTADVATQLWIAGRWMESVGFLVFPMLMGRRVKAQGVLWIYGAATALLLAAIFHWEVFPACYAEGKGLTAFKKLSEYGICLVLTGAMVLLRKRRESFDPSVYRLLAAAILTSIAGELAFTFYVSVYGLSNLAGHYLKILSFFLIYLALVRSALVHPYTTLFRDLDATRQDLERRERYYRTVLDSLQEEIRILDLDGTIAEVNGTFLEGQGLEREKVVGRHCRELLAPGGCCDRSGECGLAEVIATGRSFHALYEDRGPGGEKVCKDILFSPLGGDADGAARQVIAAARDVTEQQSVEARLAASERHLRTLVETAPVSIMTFDKDGIVDFVNDYHMATFARNRYEKDFFIGTKITELPGLMRSGRAKELEPVLHGTPVKMEEVYFPEMTGGHSGYQRIQAVPFLDGEAVAGGILLREDITDLKEARNQLERERALLQTVFDSSPDILALKDRDGTYRLMNPAFHAFVDYPRKELPSCTDEELFPAPEAERHRREDAEVFATGASRTLERQVTGKNGPRWLQVIKTPVKDARGKVTGVLCSARDITQRKLAEEALRESRRTLNTLMGNLPGMAFRCRNDPQWTMEFVSRGCRALTGYSPEDLVESRRLSYNDLVHPRDRDEVWDRVQKALRERRPYEVEYRIRRIDGEERWVWERGVGVWSGGGEPPAIEGFVTDVTERKAAEAELQRLGAAIDQAAETVIITDARGTIEYANPACEAVTGYSREEVIGKSPRIFASGRHDKAFYRELWSTLAAGDVWIGHFTNRKKDGTLYREEAVISPVRDARGRIAQFVAVKRDVTKETELEEQLRQARKMEAVGNLAGGVAHDFNNMLSPILGYSEMLLAEAPPDSEARRHLLQIKKAAEKSRNLTRQLLAFGRKQVLRMTTLDLREVVRDMEKLIRRTLREDIQLTIVPASVPCMVRADAGQVEQILLNLVVNAQDAMSHGGTLTLGIARARLNGERQTEDPEAVPGDYGTLVVSDTGCGMDDETRRRIFEPFFSTKGEGGTGLGLATVYGIVKQHGGSVRVRSEVGKGSVFQVCLPASEEAASPVEEIRAKEKVQARGEETILLVEDNAMVRKMTRTILLKQGYRVLGAAGGKEALRELETASGPVDLLLTDVVMPDMNGKELFLEVSKRHPETKVLYMSGYADEVVARHGVLEAGTELIPKPFSMEELTTKVREVLEGRRVRPAPSREGAAP